MKVVKKIDITEMGIYFIIIISTIRLSVPLITIIRYQLATGSKGLVTIKGRVIFPEYKQGNIFIAAWDTPFRKTRNIIGKARISHPGPYVLSVPVTFKKVYIVGFNDVNNNRVYERDEAVCYYGYPGSKKAIDTTSGHVEKIDLRMFSLR